MRSILHYLTSLLIISLAFTGCKKESETFTSEPISDYFPLKTGNYITYRIDSTVFVNFGRNMEIHSYQEKHLVDQALNDNLGRPAYRVFRFIRDTAGLTPWVASGSYFVTNLGSTLELTENNLRQLKMVLPLREGYNWKGNRYMPTEPYQSFYNFSNDDNMQDWEFNYEELGGSLTIKNQNIPNVIKISQVDESVNVPITTPTAYASINFGEEYYAKNIGLVQQQLIMWEYQPNPGGVSPYRVGFGIKRVMIDRNY